MTAIPVQVLLLFAVVVVVYSKGHEREVVPNATCSVCCLQGPPGVSGVNGHDGAIGPQGVPGVNGRNGAIGPPGVAGVNGVNGHDGRNGLNGRNGLHGRNGDRGPPGERGPAGEPGTINKEDLRSIVRSLIGEEENSRSRTCFFLIGQSRSDPAQSCRSILDGNPDVRSQNY